jgi:predicted dinucleotide-binding enzyme
MTKTLKSIGIIGSGPVGRGLAVLLSAAGYPVVVGTGHPAAPALSELPPEVAVRSFTAAADEDLIILAVRHGAARKILQDAGDRLKGKLVIDTMNPWIAADYRAAGMHPGLTEGTWLSRLLPQSHVARAYSHIDWDKLVPGGRDHPGKWAALYAADDEETSKRVEKLIEDTGYVPVRLGNLAESSDIDPGGSLWPGMFLPQDVAAGRS